MRPVDCPWQAVDRVLKQLPADVRVIVVDFQRRSHQRQATHGPVSRRPRERRAGHAHPRVDGRREIFPGGTAFQCDVGMTGPYDSILGRRIDRVLETTTTFVPTQFEVASGDVRLAGTIVEVDPQTGRAQGIRRLRVTQVEAQELAKLVQSPALAIDDAQGQ